MVEGDFFSEPENREAAPREDARPNRRVRPDQGELIRRELSELQQDRVGNADLPHIVQGGRTPDERHLRVREPDLLREERRHLTDALGVVPGIVVAELRRAGEPLDNLNLRRLELAGALAHLGLEHLVLALDLEVEEPRLQEGADAEQHLVRMERLADEVLRAARQRLTLRSLAQITGQHQDREVARLRDLVQLIEHRQTIHVRHVQVEQNQIRPETHVRFGNLPRIHRAFDAAEAGALQHSAQERDVLRLVVDDQDARVLEDSNGHRGAKGTCSG